MKLANATVLKPKLDALYASFDHPDAASDPVNLVRRFERPADREVAGFCAAALAFGRVASVLQSIEALFAVMGPEPAAFVRAFEPREYRTAFEPLVHRWTRGTDLMALLWVLRSLLEQYGSLEACFLAADNPAAPDIGPALEAFSRRALATDLRPVYRRVPARPGVCYFFPRPSAGSACKRLNLFLRWMVRRDGVDLGVWKHVSPARLVVPLDTHVIRLGQCLRLTRYRSPGWRMAADITASLRALDPADPVKYDFALCHVGMMGACGFRTRARDSRCPLKGLCRPPSR
ncbi:MAG TPA: TIGR02757 family protein [Vicinamibacterales bacterium]|nr:TIGR02757 family protein [Vicinamibacterales bacterium]